ncbi:MAG: hypothetical protein PHS93_00030 [Candidatus Omnitrophica bacterium]|nr:hypothetical protein [Candidatus Omnitrophota bacterium]MDD5351549.1 hypothetical protein [Candidatus Omnitrophota bacterium]MDD5550984.1 hypothetical protein [Candidatus Omnitrophota bacterium]
MADRSVKTDRQHKSKRAQATLEITLAFICLTVLLSGAIYMFIWFTERLAHRQEDYESTRVAAGSIAAGNEGVYINESNYPKLDIFGESH